jgi:uncharacterized protein YoxC
MIDLVADIGGLLLQAATLPDTIVTRTVAGERSWFETVTSIASGLMSMALLVLTIFLVPAAWNFRNSYKKVNDLLDRIYGDINPMMRHASSIADNVDYVATAVRTDVQQVRRTVQLANERLLAAVTATEQRVREFNALLEVVQQEAENTFVAAAATARGVRAGVTALREDLEEDLRARRGDRLAEAELTAALESEDVDDGDNDDTPADSAERPRIRSRNGERDL